MKDAEVIALIGKAKESLDAAKLLLKSGYPDFSSSRSYYAMFYAAQALLLTKNLTFSKHSAVISAFGKEFIKSGLLPITLHRYILEAFEARKAGDYGKVSSVTEETAVMLTKQAEEFIGEVEAYLEQIS